MTKTLELAVEKIKKLSPEAQDAIGLDLLDQVAGLEELRDAVRVGIDQLDSGLGIELDLDEELKRLHRQYDGRR